MDIEDVKARWKKYVAELYHDDRPEKTEIEIDNDNGPTKMREEERAAIDDTKAGKAVGED